MIKTTPVFSEIVFLQCPAWDIAMPPLGPAYLSAALRNQGVKTSVFDLNILLYTAVSAKNQYLWEQKSFDYWVDNALFADTWLKLEGATEKLLDKFFRDNNPEFIGISVSFAGINFASQLLKLIKRKNQKVKILVGGWGMSDRYMRSLFPQELIDAMIVGEGEYSVKEAMDILSGEKEMAVVPGVIFNKSRDVDFTARAPIADLDSLPWPTFEEFNLNLYKYRILPLFSSRGCISRCSFCNDWPFSQPYRHRSAQHVFSEIKYHLEHNHVRILSFKDLLCNGNIRELEVLCDLIINAGLRFSWDSQAIARKEMSLELLSKLKKACCSSLIYGVESFSDRVLRCMGKLFTKEILERVIKDTHSVGIAVLFNIIVGFPGETEEDFQETLESLERNRPYITKIGAISVCLVNGNSSLDLNYQQHGIILPSDNKIRAKKWISQDGKNTYEMRRARADKVIDLVKKLGLNYDTATL